MLKDFNFFVKKIFFDNKRYYEKKLKRLANKPVEPEIKILKEICNKDKASIDIGVFRGVYSYCLSGLCKAVYGFEANPIMYKVLEKKLCKIKDNIKIYNMAVSNEVGVAKLKIPIRENYLYSFKNDGTYHKSSIPFYKKSFLKKNFEDYYEAGLATIDKQNNLNNKIFDEFSVKKIRIDDFNFEYNIGFIKIDVEGHEFECLQGAKKILEIGKPNLLIEINKIHTKKYQLIFDYLRDLNYSCFFYDDDKLVKISKYEDNPREDFKNFIFRVI